ncbi:ATP-dependent DNA helicase [Longibacter salinarum]|uniref:DNA 3'-5' helicase n=1 Tax=Longibacter salinarum TaxID=1850348 RepID=A0A2A8CWF8_9BACT|nr:ATP-dependent helicase [Longibacter salinarum]PEN13079.1 ATP-dependent DNA helicase [Longibacter salinarum]
MARRIVLSSDDGPSRSVENLTIDYRGDLNEQQFDAATTGSGPTLVIAGAGTGKTRTLIYRMAYLVETGTKPESVVLLTFTRRAAREMTSRAADLLDGRCQRVQGGTFHAFCLGVLRRHAPTIGFPRNFTVLDAADAGDVISVLRADGNYDQGEERFPQKRTLYSMFSAVINRQEPLDEVLARRYPQFSPLYDGLEQMRQDYQAYKKSHGMMDFDDLLYRTLELFAADDGVRREVAGRCRHVLVDEYQDTNALQAELVKQFASVHGNVMVVGDDAQSIYRFRGADFRNIFAFPEEFDDTQVLKLEQNYRSTQVILDLANHVIDNADRSYEKTLFSHRDVPDAELPAVVPAADGQMESRFVAQMILRLRESGVPLHEQAVLFRSSHNSYELETELNKRNIPFVKYGGMKLSEAAHIKDVLAHLKVAENPQDAAAWNRALQLIHGIGPKTAKSLIEWATNEADDPFVHTDNAPFSNRYISQLKKLLGTLRSIRDPDMPLVEQVESVIDYYRPIFEDEYYEDYPKREPDLDHFIGLSENYSSRRDFLSSLALDPIELTALDNDGEHEDEPPLVLSTIHSAKGLEFHTVFIIRALEGDLPSRYALREKGGVDEELRLFYVAVTRAEDNLFISYPMTQYRRYQGEYMTDPSRFIVDVPEDTLEPVQLVEETEAQEDDQPLLGGDTPAALGSGDSEQTSASAPKQLGDGSDSASRADTETSREYDPRDVDGLPF